MREKVSVVIITGQSGAGKTKTIGIIEDLGFFCVDNLPPNLIEDFINLVLKTGGRINKLGIVVDVRSGTFLEKLPEIIKRLKNNQELNVKLLFLEASDEALIKRFSETRRKHPISEGNTIQQKIAIEKE
ncbi:RNase adaptor protein RapZ, partial [bacterium]|nr:RNase adaptor protein RapZ [bacterium]